MSRRGRRALAVLALAALLQAALAAPAWAWEGVRLAGLLFFFRQPALVAGPAVIRTSAFTDTADSPARDDFTLLAGLRILRGARGPNGPIHPGAEVTRAELATVVVRMLGQERLVENKQRLEADARYFDDDDEIPAWARDYARVAAGDLRVPGERQGLMRLRPGTDRGRFAAGEAVTVDEAVAVLRRALEWWDGRSWPDPARREAERLLRSRLGERDPGAALTRAELAILVRGGLEAGHHDLETGRLEPDRSILATRGDTRRGWNPQLEDGGSVLRLYDGPGDNVSFRYELAPEVFLVGAASLEEVRRDGRPVLALGAGDGLVTCIVAR